MLIAVLLAKKARRPVKIELTNQESMATVKRRHNEHTRGKMGCTADGGLTLAQFDHVIDDGGYGFKDETWVSSAWTCGGGPRTAASLFTA